MRLVASTLLFAATILSVDLPLAFLARTSVRESAAMDAAGIARVVVDADVQAPASPPVICESESREREAVAALLSEYRLVYGMGGAAKGAIDDLRQRVDELMTSANAAAIAGMLAPEELATSVGTIVLQRWLALDVEAASAWIAAQLAATEEHAFAVAEALARQPERLRAFCERLGRSAWAQSFLDHSIAIPRFKNAR